MPLQTWRSIHFVIAISLFNYELINDTIEFGNRLQELQILVENVEWKLIDGVNMDGNGLLSSDILNLASSFVKYNSFNQGSQ